MALDEQDKQWISEQLERVETKLLTAFHEWASPMHARQRSHSAALEAFDLELEQLKNRVQKIEEDRRPAQ